MARLTFPDEGSRLVFTPGASGAPLLGAANQTAHVYLDATGQTPADISLSSGGASVAGSVLSIDYTSRLPIFYGPPDGTDTLYVVVAGGPPAPAYARVDDRLDAINTTLATLATSTALTTEANTRATADTANATAIANEITRATSAEGTNAAAIATKSPALTRTAVKTANYTAAPSDLVPVDTATPNANITVTLPTAPANGSRVAVKHIAVGTGRTVTVAAAGSDVFNKSGGPTTLTLSLVYQAVSLQYDGGIWSVVSDDLPLGQLDARFTPLTASDNWLKVYAANPDSIIAGAITRDGNGAATSAPVVWPDSTVGTYTADTVSTAFPGAVDAYHITYGSPATKTVTQPAVTRDATTGAVTNRPAMTVA